MIDERHTSMVTLAPTPESVKWALEHFALPDELVGILTQAAERLDSTRWLIARVTADYILQCRAELGAEWEVMLRPAILAAAARIVGLETSTMREYVHTAEIIPRGTENEPGYAALRWSHFVRAARAGSWEAARAILDALGAKDVSRGPPTVGDARRLLSASRGTPSGDVEGEGESPPGGERRYFQVEVMLRALVTAGGMAQSHLCALLDNIPDLVEGDTLLICKLVSRGE
jgi:hypothetical protein